MGTNAIGNAASPAIHAAPLKDEDGLLAEQGDTLGSIARKLGISDEDLHKANPDVLNPDVVYPGQRLNIPNVPQKTEDNRVSAANAAPTTARSAETKIGEGSASATGKITLDDPAHGRRDESAVTAKVDKDGLRGSARLDAAQTTPGQDGASAKRSAAVEGGVSVGSNGVGADVKTEVRTETTTPEGRTSSQGSTITAGASIGADGVKISNGSKTETQTSASGENTQTVTGERKTDVKLSADSVSASSDNTRTHQTTTQGGTQAAVKRSQGGSVTFGANDFNIEKKASIGGSVKGKVFSAEAQVELKAKIEGSNKTTDGTTTSSLAVTGSAKATIAAKAAKFGAGASLEVGQRVAAATSLPEVEAKGKDISPLKVNPLDPSSMPKGASFTLDSTRFSNTGLEASFAVLKGQVNASREGGTSLRADKIDDNKVRLTAGPTSALTESGAAGLDFGVASALLGRSDKTSEAQLKTAEFDLTTPEGRAGYHDALLSGQFPTQNGTGVSGVATIKKFDVTSQAKLDGSIASFAFSAEGAKSAGNDVATVFPDGTMTRTTQIQNDNNVPLVITRKYDAKHNELVDERRYSYKVDVKGETSWLVSSQFMKLAPSKQDPTQAKSATMTFTETEMQGVMDRAKKAASPQFGANDDARQLSHDYDGKFTDMTPQDFAVSLARNRGGTQGAQGGFVNHFVNISQSSQIIRDADGGIRLDDTLGDRLPGTLSLE